MIDKIDLLIIDLLKQNSKLPLKEIGEQVHLTPQAVSNRILRLQEENIITQFTICTNDELLGQSITAFITVFMKTLKHNELIRYIKNNPLILEAHKISGQGCYLLKVTCSSMDEVNAILDDLNVYGTYQLNLSTSTIK